MKKRNNIAGYERIKIGSNIRKWRNIKEIKQKDLASSMRLISSDETPCASSAIIRLLILFPFSQSRFIKY